MNTATLLLPGQNTSERYGQGNAELASGGKLSPDNDIRIAAVARQFDLPLVTRDFRFAAASGLTTLDW